jgi:DNA invertase Pin-like site-specific DNA recombinase
MQAIGYFRADAVTQKSGPGRSAIAFEEDFREYCDLNLHQPIKTFGDLNASGSDDYPQYTEMVGYIQERESDFLVVVPDSSHLGRDLETLARSFVELEGIGAKVTCEDEKFPDPIQNAFHVLGVTGISRTRSARIKESMQARAMKGQGMGRPPFGYRIGDDGVFEIVGDEAPVVELIFRLYTNDAMGMRLIVQHLNERDIRTRRGGRWNVVSIRDILRNPVYMGTYTRFGLRLPRSHEPIIPPQVYRAAQDTVRSRRPVGRVPRAEPYLLSGIVQCGHCGNTMMGVTRRQRWRNKDGKRRDGVYRYYQCQSKNNQSICGYHTWRAALLEATVISQIGLALEAKKGGNGVTATDDERSSQLRSIWEGRVRNAERRFVQAMRRAARGAASIETFARSLSDLDASRARVQRASDSTDMSQTLKVWDQLDFDTRRDSLLAHLVRVEVKDEMVRVEV